MAKQTAKQQLEAVNFALLKMTERATKAEAEFGQLLAKELARKAKVKDRDCSLAMDELFDEIVSLQEELADIKKELADAESDRDGAQEEAKEAEDKIADLESDLHDLRNVENQLDSLQWQMDQKDPHWLRCREMYRQLTVKGKP